MNKFSALDIAGAPTYLLIAIVFWFYIFTQTKEKEYLKYLFGSTVFALFSTFGFIFCVARLFGAHK